MIGVLIFIGLCLAMAALLLGVVLGSMVLATIWMAHGCWPSELFYRWLDRIEAKGET